MTILTILVAAALVGALFNFLTARADVEALVEVIAELHVESGKAREAEIKALQDRVAALETTVSVLIIGEAE